MRSLLDALLARVELDDPVFAADEVARLSAGAWSSLVDAGLVRPASTAATVTCLSCPDAHEEEVRWTRAPHGMPSRPFIPCPEHGCDWVEPERLLRWAVDLDALANAVASAIGAAGDVASLVPADLWSLGRTRVQGRTREWYLARRLDRPATAARVAACEPLRRAVEPVLLAMGALPPDATWHANAPTVIALADVASLVRGHLAVDAEHLAALLGYAEPDPATDQVRESPVPTFPTPRGAIWDNVEIRFRDGHSVSIRVLGVGGVFTYAELGLTNRTNGAPDKQWLLLEAMSREQGALTWNNTFRDHKNKKRRARLSERLIAFFGIDDGDPITYDKDLGGWRTRFKLWPEGDAVAP